MFTNLLRNTDDEDRIFNSYLKYFCCTKGNHSHGLRFHWDKFTSQNGNKRAMMALDCSPESLSSQMNSTSLFLWFQLVTLGVGPVLIPRGIIWIKLTKVYKEMLHTENLSSIPSSFREEEFWSWSSLFLCSNLWPHCGVSFDSKGIIWNYW